MPARPTVGATQRRQPAPRLIGYSRACRSHYPQTQSLSNTTGLPNAENELRAAP